MKKIESVKENVNFKRAYHRGKSASLGLVNVHWRKNNLGKRRLGITVSKKLGSSPVRNRTRRIIRAAAYSCRDILPKGCDIIVVARSQIIGAKSTDVERVLNAYFKKVD